MLWVILLSLIQDYNKRKFCTKTGGLTKTKTFTYSNCGLFQEPGLNHPDYFAVVLYDFNTSDARMISDRTVTELLNRRYVGHRCLNDSMFPHVFGQCHTADHCN